MMERPIGGFDEVETWVCDLDSTLYAHRLDLWQQVAERIRDYIVGFFQVMDCRAFARRRTTARSWVKPGNDDGVI